MKKLFFLVLIAGCSPAATPDRMDLLCECFSTAAFEAYKAKVAPKSPEPHKECCKECGGTGRVRSGDNLSWVACPCPDTCKCKCKDGKCATKK